MGLLLLANCACGQQGWPLLPHWSMLGKQRVLGYCALMLVLAGGDSSCTASLFFEGSKLGNADFQTHTDPGSLHVGTAVRLSTMLCTGGAPLLKGGQQGWLGAPHG